VPRRPDRGDKVTGFVLRRLLQSVVVVLGVTVAVFLLEHAIPGSLARAVLGTRASPAAIAAFDRTNGLDRSLPGQYLTFLDHLVHGDLGYSYRLNESVDALIAHELPNDAVLIGASLALAVALAIPIGILQAVRRNHAIDHAATGILLALYSMPSYWLGLVLIAWFSIHWHLLPAEAPQAWTLTGILADPRALVLPVATLTLVNVALFSRYMRASAIATLAEDFVRTARAKGLSPRLVLERHVLRNSLLSIVTLIGLSIPGILTAGLVVENVFNFPGIGLSYFYAATSSDYPVELGITALVAIATVVGNLVADIGYAVLDPRVRVRSER